MFSHVLRRVFTEGIKLKLVIYDSFKMRLILDRSEVMACKVHSLYTARDLLLWDVLFYRYIVLGKSYVKVESVYSHVGMIN